MIHHDKRGVTAPLEYVYTFAIATILITGLIIAATNAAGDQRRRTVEAQMDVVAQQVAGSLEDADRIVQSTDGNPDELELEHELPDSLLGSGYRVTIGSGDDPAITVSSPIADEEITAEASLGATSIPDAQNVRGGHITIRCVETGAPTTCSDELEVSND